MASVLDSVTVHILLINDMRISVLCWNNNTEPGGEPITVFFHRFFVGILRERREQSPVPRWRNVRTQQQKKRRIFWFNKREILMCRDKFEYNRTYLSNDHFQSTWTQMTPNWARKRISTKKQKNGEKPIWEWNVRILRNLT